jgi:bifunctional non-homologous end joining protein LigD
MGCEGRALAAFAWSASTTYVCNSSTRTGLDWTTKYPRAIEAFENVNVKTAYLDGELRRVDEEGFAQTQAATDGERDVHLVYYAFDLLPIEGWDVSILPLGQAEGPA